MVRIEKRYDVYRLLAEEDSEYYKKGETIITLDTLQECLDVINGSEYELIDADKELMKNKAVEIIKEKLVCKTNKEAEIMITSAKGLGLITEDEENYLTTYYRLFTNEKKLVWEPVEF